MAGEPFSFTGEDALNYDRYLGPLMFEPASRAFIKNMQVPFAGSILEVACGTGRLTKYLRDLFPDSSRLVATDISEDMLALAKQIVAKPGIEFAVADARQLPFSDQSFDLVVCQYGLMFLPDKLKGFQEAFRVLKPGGSFLFATWDSPDSSPLIHVIIEETIIPFFGGEKPDWFRTPFSLYDTEKLLELSAQAGFAETSIRPMVFKAGQSSAKDVVNGFLVKHPLGRAVLAKNPTALDGMAGEMEQRISSRFGSEAIDTELCAWFGCGKRVD